MNKWSLVLKQVASWGIKDVLKKLKETVNYAW